MSEETNEEKVPFKTGGEVPNSGEAVVVEEEEKVERPKRVTRKPKPKVVKFEVLRPFAWSGKFFKPGESGLEEDEFDQMMYELNLRTDRLIFVRRLG